MAAAATGVPETCVVAAVAWSVLLALNGDTCTAWILRPNVYVQVTCAACLTHVPVAELAQETGGRSLELRWCERKEFGKSARLEASVNTDEIHDREHAE